MDNLLSAHFILKKSSTRMHNAHEGELLCVKIWFFNIFIIKQAHFLKPTTLWWSLQKSQAEI